METYRTEEEQVEALRRWWDENGRSTIAAVVIAVAGAFGWQSWQGYSQQQSDNASDLYQAMMGELTTSQVSDEQRVSVESYADQLKTGYEGSTYAQFAALQVARLAVQAQELERAEAELRWVLGKATPGGDIAQVAELRLARVLAARGEGEQALQILAQADEGSYGAAYAMARGDVLLSLGRDEEAREAYTLAQAQGAGQRSGGSLEQKLQSLTPVPASEVDAEPVALPAVEQAADEAPAEAEADTAADTDEQGEG